MLRRTKKFVCMMFCTAVLVFAIFGPMINVGEAQKQDDTWLRSHVKLLIDQPGCEIQDLSVHDSVDHDHISVESTDSLGSQELLRPIFRSEYIGETLCPILDNQGLKDHNVIAEELKCSFTGVNRPEENLDLNIWKPFDWKSCALEEQYIVVRCSFNQRVYHQILLLARIIPERKYVVKQHCTLPVVVIGISKLSHFDFRRFMQKTSKFMENNIKSSISVRMNGLLMTAPTLSETQNILLTGTPKFEEAADGHLWNEFTEAGYRHYLIKDKDEAGLASNYSDVNPQKFLAQVLAKTEYFEDDFGFAENIRMPETRLKLYLNYAADLINIHGPDRSLFVYSWIDQTDKFGLETIDGLLSDFLVKLEDNSFLESIFFVLVSNQGSDCPSGDDSCLHHQKLPLGHIVTPYDYIYRITEKVEKAKFIRSNEKKVVTIFDVYATLFEIGAALSGSNGRARKGESLLGNYIKASRSCEDTLRPDSQCPCGKKILPSLKT